MHIIMASKKSLRVHTWSPNACYVIAKLNRLSFTVMLAIYFLFGFRYLSDLIKIAHNKHILKFWATFFRRKPSVEEINISVHKKNKTFFFKVRIQEIFFSCFDYLKLFSGCQHKCINENNISMQGNMKTELETWSILNSFSSQIRHPSLKVLIRIRIQTLERKN